MYGGGHLSSRSSSHTLKPYVIDWFERTEEAFADGDEDEGDEDYRIEEKTLSAIFQFAKVYATTARTYFVYQPG